MRSHRCSTDTTDYDSTNAMKQLRELGAGFNTVLDGDKPIVASPGVKSTATSSSITDCCICEFLT